MAPVVVGAPFGLAGLHRQQRGGAVEGLNLGLFVNAQHHGVLGRIDIQPDDVTDFVDQQRVRRQLEGLAAVGPQTEGAPNATDGHAAESRRAGERACAPVRSAGRGRFQRGDDHLFDLGIRDRARRSRAGLIEQAVDPVPCEAHAPLADGRRRQPQAAGHRLVVLASRAAEHDARAPGQLRGRAGAPGQRLEVLPLGVTKNDGNGWASRSHATSLNGEDEDAHIVALYSGTGH